MSIYKSGSRPDDPTRRGDDGDEAIIPAESQPIIEACISNANDLVIASELLLKSDLPNIAYHLAALALEEIGKSEILGVMHFAEMRKREFSDRHLDDHVRKLFWALWGPSFGYQVISGPQLEAFRGLASNIHKTRLLGLYVEPSESGFLNPRDAASKEQCELIVSMARTRVDLAKMPKKWVLNADERKVLNWFLTVTEDQEKRRWLFSQISMEKLAEVHDVRAWMRWCREQFEASEIEATQLAEHESRREKPTSDVASKDKWRIKIRLYSDSHSIRSKELNPWNAMSTGFRLFPVSGKKNQLIFEATFPNALPIHALWWIGWGFARRFVVALNIGSGGFFWWYLPEQISKFYDEIEDLENRANVLIERNPRLKITWGNQVLTAQVLNRVALCLAKLPNPQQTQLHKPFDHYLTGLGFLSKTDVHIQFEPHAFVNLYNALKLGMLQYGDWKQENPFRDAFEAMLEKCLGGVPEYKSLIQFVEVAEGLEENRPPSKPLDLGDVGMMKVITDSYFLWRFDQHARERAAAESQQASQKPQEDSKRSSG